MSTPQTLPPAIEIFRPGRHTDDAGGVHEFSAQDVAGMAAGYNAAVREAPLTVGHPAHNLPAYGWVKGLAVNADGRLAMDTHKVEPQFAEMVASGRFSKRSASFYPPGHPSNPTPGQWYLRHVAFLGAQPPAISGLKDIQFSEAEEGVVQFSEQEPTHQEHPMTEEEKAAIARAEKAEADAKAAQDRANAAEAAKDAAVAAAKTAGDQLAQFAEAGRQAAHAAHVSFAEAQVKAGRMLPKDQNAAVAVLDLLAESKPVSFAEGDATKEQAPVEWLKSVMSNAAPVINFGEHAPGNAGAGGQQAAKGMSDAEIDKRAKAYAREKSVSYAEALTAVASFTADA